eukprot:scaffold33997_cov65-Phaeocystis_antarctica.AAC.1
MPAATAAAEGSAAAGAVTEVEARVAAAVWPTMEWMSSWACAGVSAPASAATACDAAPALLSAAALLTSRRASASARASEPSASLSSRVTAVSCAWLRLLASESACTSFSACAARASSASFSCVAEARRSMAACCCCRMYALACRRISSCSSSWCPVGTLLPFISIAPLPVPGCAPGGGGGAVTVRQAAEVWFSLAWISSSRSSTLALRALWIRARGPADAGRGRRGWPPLKPGLPVEGSALDCAGLGDCGTWAAA